MKGFSGKSALKFSKSVNDVVQDAISSPYVKQNDSFSKGIEWEDGYRLPKKVPNIGNDRVISFSEDQISYVMEQTRQIDDDATEVMFSVIEAIEKMCEEDYYIPSAIPKILDMTDYLKKQLQESNDIARSTSQTGKAFTQSIIDQDNII